MKILSIESSAKSASASITEDQQIIAEHFINTRLTHSQTLLPMVESILSSSGIKLEEIDAFAVSAGPGSFTGLRIGIACIKGLAFANNKPCAGVSTLAAMARNITYPGWICAVMDARCAQVYTALFHYDGDSYRRVWEDEAIAIEQLKEKLQKINETVFLVGDGAQLCYNKLAEVCPNLKLAAESQRYQRASSVGLEALEQLKTGHGSAADQLVPSYLRLPQAQRELLAKQAAQEGKNNV